MTSGLQPPNSGAPQPVQGVTGGPPVLGGQLGNDPSTGNIVIAPNPGNATQIRKGTNPQALQVYEYFHTNTDYSRIALNAQTGGPFQLAVETAPSTVVRGLNINANGPLTINTQFTQFNTGITVQGGNIVCNQTLQLSGLVSAGGGTGVLVIGASTTTTATAGGGTALPATPIGYLQWALGTAFIKIPYYAQ